MWTIICLCVGALLCYLCTGLYVWSIATPVNRWLHDDAKVTGNAILTWPSDVKRMAEAGTVTGQTLAPHPNRVAGND